ncbi:SDR family NAD(P)-dependent oxidoreductase [Geodermatophilus sp. SYSU D00815]
MTQTALITGGAGSIGPALATSFVDAGFETYILDISPRIDEVAEATGARPLRADVTDLDSVRAAVEGIESLDALVTAVGAWPQLEIDELTMDDWNQQIAINLTGVFVAVKALLGPLRAARGSVVNFSSSVALKGYAEMIPYGAAKAGVIGLTRSLAVSLGRDGINVNTVIPGGMLTESNHNLSPEVLEEMRTARAIARDGYATDLVGAVQFFASPAAEFVTGQSLVVDGGFLFH